MFAKEWPATLVENTRTKKIICENCNNETEHEVLEQPYGPCVGAFWAKKPLLSLKYYYLVCPICSTIAENLTKEQMIRMKI